VKKGKILNKKLNTAISDMGHGDILIICDAGFPIPGEEQRIDLAITQDVPGVIQILELIISDFIYESVIVAEEQSLYNPVHFKRVCELCRMCEVETVPHTDIIGKYRDQAKYFVRTGGLEPWGNIVLISGIDAPEYFKKEGVIVPDYYEERVRGEHNE
jgi:D-ribose pyranase